MDRFRDYIDANDCVLRQVGTLGGYMVFLYCVGRSAERLEPYQQNRKG